MNETPAYASLLRALTVPAASGALANVLSADGIPVTRFSEKNGRIELETAPVKFNFLDLEFYPEHRMAMMRGEILDLRPQQYLLLEMLARANGEVVTFRFLKERVWGDTQLSDDDNSVRTLVDQVRPALRGRYAITAVRGVGYKLEMVRTRP